MTLRRKSLVTDNTFLVCLYYLGLLDQLAPLYSCMYIPESVLEEFLNVSAEEKNDRFDFIMRGFEEFNIRKCVSFDRDTMTLLDMSETLHAGEKEVIAQSRDLVMAEENPTELFAILDDNSARKQARKMDLNINGTLRILADLETRLGAIDYRESVNFLVQERGQWFVQPHIDAALRMSREAVEKGE